MTFGDLRHDVHRRNDRQAFEALFAWACDLQAQGPCPDGVLDYLLGHLSSWDPRARARPARFAERTPAAFGAAARAMLGHLELSDDEDLAWLEPETVPPYLSALSLDLSGSSLVEFSERIAALGLGPQLRHLECLTRVPGVLVEVLPHVETLTLRAHYTIDLEALALALGEARCLRELSIACPGLDELALLEALDYLDGTLERLTLILSEEAWLSPRPLRALLAHEALAELEQLTIGRASKRYLAGEHRLLEAIAEAPCASSLRELRLVAIGLERAVGLPDNLERLELEDADIDHADDPRVHLRSGCQSRSQRALQHDVDLAWTKRHWLHQQLTYLAESTPLCLFTVVMIALTMADMCRLPGMNLIALIALAPLLMLSLLLWVLIGAELYAVVMDHLRKDLPEPLRHRRARGLASAVLTQSATIALYAVIGLWALPQLAPASPTEMTLETLYLSAMWPLSAAALAALFASPIFLWWLFDVTTARLRRLSLGP